MSETETKKLECKYPDMICVMNKIGESNPQCWHGDNALEYALTEAKQRAEKGIEVFVSFDCPVWDSTIDKPLEGGYTLRYKKASWVAFV